MAMMNAMAVVACLAAMTMPADAFVVTTSMKVGVLSRRGCSARNLPALSSLRLCAEGKESESANNKWSVNVVDENAERIESVKIALLSSLAGSIAMAPLAVIEKSSFYPSEAFSAQWELAHDGSGAAVESVLAFGAAAAAIEIGFAQGWVKKFPSS
eukprot:746816-Hanusia_phi.AAC.1